MAASWSDEGEVRVVLVRVSGGTRQRPYVTGLFPACFSIGPLLIVGGSLLCWGRVGWDKGRGCDG